jgi:glycosyltransferase involved in cell wall biosynthesis
MMIGMPIVGFATTEMATAVQNGISGFVDTNVSTLIQRMDDLLKNPTLAAALGQGARRYALERFGIERFVRDWEETFATVTGRPSIQVAVPAGVGS